MGHWLSALFHIAIGIAATAAMAWAAAWAVPLASATIWDVAFVMMAVIAGLGVWQVRHSSAE